MSEQVRTDDPIVKVARDLTEITNLAGNLPSQALDQSSHRLMPGGMALVSLAPDADMRVWSARIDAAERWHLAQCPKADHSRCRYVEHVSDEDDQDHEDPLRTLLFWSEAWREERGFPLEGRTPTLATEASFIRHCLDWAWENEPHWDDFTRDINQARRNLENLVHAGERTQRSRVRCINPTCATQPRLIRSYRSQAAKDVWKCTHCGTEYGKDEFKRAYAKQLRSEGAERFVPLRDAIGALEAFGRHERLIRKWLASDDEDEPIPVCCELGTRRILVWWPGLWQRHRNTETRQRRSA